MRRTLANAPGRIRSAADLRCLFVSVASRTGGAERSLGLLVRYLAKAGVCCAVAKAGGMDDSSFTTASTSVIRLPDFEPVRRPRPVQFLGLCARWLGGSLALAYAILRVRPHIVHANTTAAMLIAVIPARLVHCPLVWHVRDLVALGWLGRWLAVRSHAVIAVSHAVRTHLLAQGVPARKAHVVPNGVDPAWLAHAEDRQARERTRDRFGVPRDCFVFINIGQYVPWKKQQLFIAAAARLALEWPAARFVLVGGAPCGGDAGCKTQLQTMARNLGVSDRMILLDWQDDMLALLAASDVLVHTACAEPFGRVLIEAMALGVPVICVDSGGPRDIIEPNVSGIAVPPDDVSALAHAMLEFRRDPIWRNRLSKNGRDRVVALFTADRVAGSTRDVYYEVLRKDPRTRTDGAVQPVL